MESVPKSLREKIGQFVNRETIILFLIFVLFTLATNPNQFDDDGPASWELWHVGETKHNITLLEINEYPFLLAVFTDGFNEYSLGENEWLTISGETFKIRIYPEKQYVWPLWKMGDWLSHIKNSLVIFLGVFIIMEMSRKVMHES